MPFQDGNRGLPPIGNGHSAVWKRLQRIGELSDSGAPQDFAGPKVEPDDLLAAVTGDNGRALILNGDPGRQLAVVKADFTRFPEFA